MRYAWGLWGFLLAQTFYIEVENEPLKRALRRKDLSTIARLGRAWNMLREVEPLVPDSLHTLNGWFIVRLAEQDSQAALDKLQSQPEVKWVEGASWRRLCTQPPLGWHHASLGTIAAWSRTQGSPSVIVALIDSGLEWELPAFHRQVWINALEDLNSNGRLDSDDLNGIDEDGNGFIDDVIGYDFTDQPFVPRIGDNLGFDPLPHDENGHGTAMASLIAARSDLSPISGLSPGARLMILRCFNAEGYGEDDDIARAIVYAAENGARIINCSFGDRLPSRMMHAAIQYAAARGCVIIAASGNGTGHEPHFPSGFPEVIAIGGLAYDESSGKHYLWPLSGYYRVDWVAPADRLPVLLPNGTVRSLSGTSLAAALSSAAAALLLSQYPHLSREGVRATFSSRAIPLGRESWSPLYGSGRLILVPALDLPQEASAGWLSPPDHSILGAPRPIVFSTYHSLLREWEISYAQSLEGPWISLAKGFTPRLRDTLRNWTPPAGVNLLRLRLQLRNGQEVAYLLTLSYVPQGLLLSRSQAAPGWWSGALGSIIDWRANSPTTGCVITGRGMYCDDKVDSVGAVWIPPSSNAEGILFTFADTVRFPIQPSTQSVRSLPHAPWEGLNLSAPFGFYHAERGPDWNGDGEMDLILSGFRPEDGRLGRIYYLQRSATTYRPYDSVSLFPLLPRHLEDWDGDGSPELLGVWADSFYVLGGTPPKTLLWKGAGRAARLAPSQQVWLRRSDGAYELRSSSGQTLLVLPDTVTWTGSTTIPRLIPVATPTETLWVFGNYLGWIFIYRSDGTLRQSIPLDLLGVGSFIQSLDLDGDGWSEILYLGQGASGNWWELGLISAQTGTTLWKERFWGGVAGQARLIVAHRKAAVWLAPQLYIGTLSISGWEAESFDADLWETFGLWPEPNEFIALLGKDSVPRFFRYEPPALSAVTWARPGGLSPTSARLRWYALAQNPLYNLYRLSLNGPPILRYSGLDTSFIDGSLVPGELYAYIVESGGAISEPFFLRPQERPCLNRAVIDSTGLCVVSGNGRWMNQAPEIFTALPDRVMPISAWANGPLWILSFPPHTYPETLLVDTLLTDANGMYLKGTCGELLIEYERSPLCITPTKWQVEGEREIVLGFSGTVPPQAYDPNRYQISPAGRIERIEPTIDGIRLVVSANLKTQPAVIRWTWGDARCPRTIALSPLEGLDGGWGVFPNPVRASDREVFIWGLSPGDEVRVLTPTGLLCAIIRATDGEVATRWNLHSISGGRLGPGIYLFQKGKSFEKVVVE
ncbi:MAG: S8 family serine peptidase [Bacteroidia bacterium]|nr:S8 family serine peptidase [Bacteroidia bacterium]